LKSDNPILVNRLNEKGVECSILIPLFETILGFDSLKDIEYEATSEKWSDRFDFLIENRFVIEAKRLNTPFKSYIKKQIEEYIFHHNNIKYGILSNGREYAVFVKKSFIKEFLNPEKKFQINMDKNVLHLLTLSINDDNFFEAIKIFSKDTYHEMFSRLAKYAITQINKTRKTKIHDDKELNCLLQEKISKTIDVQHGQFLKEIQDGKINVDQQLTYNNGFLKITVIVQKDGRILLEKGQANVFDMKKAMESNFEPMIKLVTDDWKNKSILFTSIDELIKTATGKKKMPRGTYVFK